MRNAVVDRKLQHLRIDHDEPALLGLEAIEQAHHHRVDRHRLARAGGAGDQQMRHAGEIDDHRLAADRLAERDGEPVLGFLEILARQQFAQVHRLAPLVGQFDADGVAPLHDGDARRDRRHRARDVVGEADDARRFDAGRGLEFVERDDRAGAHVDDFALDAEIVEHALEQPRVLLQRVLGDLRGDELLRFGEHGERRQFVGVAVEQRKLRFARRAASGLERAGRRGDARRTPGRAASPAPTGHRRFDAPVGSRRERGEVGGEIAGLRRSSQGARAAGPMGAARVVLRAKKRRSALLRRQRGVDHGADRDEPEARLAVAVVVVAVVALRRAPRRRRSWPPAPLRRRRPPASGDIPTRRSGRGSPSRPASDRRAPCRAPSRREDGAAPTARRRRRRRRGPVGSGQLAGAGSSEAQPAASVDPASHKREFASDPVEALLA